MTLLSDNPRHPGLQSHEINALTARYGMKVWESYLENNTPAAGRIFWVYGPNQGDITIIGLEPHPDDKSTRIGKLHCLQWETGYQTNQASHEDRRGRGDLAPAC